MSEDALLCRWPWQVCYAFFVTLLQQVCVKLLKERPQTLFLVAPVIPVTSWFPRLARWAPHAFPILPRLLSLQSPTGSVADRLRGYYLWVYVISCPILRHRVTRATFCCSCLGLGLLLLIAHTSLNGNYL